MKQLTVISSLLISSITFVGCDDSASTEFEEVNGKVERKLITSITGVSSQSTSESLTYTFTYDGNNKLSSISDGVETQIFVYNNGNLSNVAGPDGTLNIEELYQSPYDAFQTGEVLSYDNNGNPQVIQFFEWDYNYTTGQDEQRVYTAELSYDNKPNPYFYTMESAGLIEVLDGVRLNLSFSPQPDEIIRARMLLPLNNPSKLIYKNESGEIVHVIDINYDYDQDNYPASATATINSPMEGGSNIIVVNYQYYAP